MSLPTRWGVGVAVAPHPFSAISSPIHLLTLAFLLVAVALFFHRLGSRDLWSSHEARAAMDAADLLQADSPGLPRLYDGRLELQKPPLYYWLVAGLGRLRGGVDALAVRLPAAVSALAIVAGVALLAARLGRPLAGLFAGLVLATSIHFPWLARIGRIDMPLALAVSLACAGFAGSLWRVGRPRYPSLFLAYSACALGVLLKGPIGLVLPGAVVASFLLLEGRWPAVWEPRSWRSLIYETGAWWGLPLVVLAAAPVYLWADQVSEGAFLREFLWHHNVERGLGGSRLRGHPWWLYGPYLLLYLLPYSPLLAVPLWRRAWREDRLARLGLAWLVGVLVVLSAARFKRADYLLPAYPGAALLLGATLERVAPGRRRLVLGGACGIAAVMIAGWLWRVEISLPAEEPYRDYRPFAAAVREHAPSPAPVAFFRAEAHALSFRVGRPLVRFVQWDELRQWLRRPGAQYVVVPPDVASEAPQQLPGARLVEVCRTTTLAGGRHERPLVLLRVEDEERATRHYAPATDLVAGRPPTAERRPPRE